MQVRSRHSSEAVFPMSRVLRNPHLWARAEVAVVVDSREVDSKEEVDKVVVEHRAEVAVRVVLVARDKEVKEVRVLSVAACKAAADLVVNRGEVDRVGSRVEVVKTPEAKVAVDRQAVVSVVSGVGVSLEDEVDHRSRGDLKGFSKSGLKAVVSLADRGMVNRAGSRKGEVARAINGTSVKADRLGAFRVVI